MHVRFFSRESCALLVLLNQTGPLLSPTVGEANASPRHPPCFLPPSRTRGSAAACRRRRPASPSRPCGRRRDASCAFQGQRKPSSSELQRNAIAFRLVAAGLGLLRRARLPPALLGAAPSPRRRPRRPAAEPAPAGSRPGDARGAAAMGGAPSLAEQSKPRAAVPFSRRGAEPASSGLGARRPRACRPGRREGLAKSGGGRGSPASGAPVSSSPPHSSSPPPRPISAAAPRPRSAFGSGATQPGCHCPHPGVRPPPCVRPPLARLRDTEGTTGAGPPPPPRRPRHSPPAAASPRSAWEQLGGGGGEPGGGGGDWSATRRGSSAVVARFPRATAAVAANPGAGARAGIAQRQRGLRAGSAWWRRASGPGAGAGNALLERRRRQCIRGERERIFSSPLSSDAKCISCMPALLESVS
jgi:hypothetical protein